MLVEGWVEVGNSEEVGRRTGRRRLAMEGDRDGVEVGGGVVEGQQGRGTWGGSSGGVDG